MHWSRLIPRYARWIYSPRDIVPYVVGGVLLLHFLQFPSYVAGSELDPSWTQALGYLFKHHYQAGEDYFFTYGPLGFFELTPYDPDLFIYKLFWEYIAKSIIAVIITVSCLKLPNRGMAWKILLLAILIPFPDEALYLLGALLAFRLIVLDTNNVITWRMFGLLFFVAVISALKFTIFLFVTALLILASIYSAFHMSFRRTAKILLIYSLSFLLTWILCGQRITNIPMFVYGSLQYALGYADAMAIWQDGWFAGLQIAVAVILSLAVLSLCIHSVVYQTPRLQGTILTLMIAAGVFLAWKHGFVRHDGHEQSFFAFCLLIPLMVPTIERASRLRAILSFTCVGGCIIGTYLPTSGHDPVHLFTSNIARLQENLSGVFFPFDLKARLNRELTQKRQSFCLPIIRAAVQNSSIDSISDFQGIVFLNDFNWKFRPVFQSHASVTDFLLKSNEEFYAGSNAPEFVIMHLRPIDNRLAGLEDSLALGAIINRYKPILAEHEYILLKRTNSSTKLSTSFKSLRDATLRWGEPFVPGQSPDKVLWAVIDIRDSLFGSLLKSLFKPPELFLDLVASDGCHFRTRLVPNMARAGFLIQPLIGGNRDVLAACSGIDCRWIESMTISARPGWEQCFNPQISIRIFELPKNYIQPLNFNEYCDLQYSMLGFCPSSIKSPLIERRNYDGQDVLMAHAPSEIHLSAGKESGIIQGRFGILPESYQIGRTEGIRFSVELASLDGATRIIYGRDLGPVTSPHDRGLQRFSVEYQLKQGEHIIFRAVPIGSAAWGASCWAGIEIK